MSVERTIDQVKEYVEAQVEYVRLMAVEQAIRLMSSASLFAILLGFGAVALLMLELALAFWLSSMWGSQTQGFSAVGAGNLLLMLVVFFFRKRILRRSRNALTRALFDSSDL